jgi:hypothetical protein
MMINDKRFGNAVARFTQITSDAQQRQAYFDHTGYQPKDSWTWKLWRPKIKSVNAKVGLEINNLDKSSFNVIYQATPTNNTLFAGWMTECKSFTLPFMITIPTNTENHKTIVVNTVCSNTNVCFELLLPYWDSQEPGNMIQHEIVENGNKLVVVGKVTRPDTWDVDGRAPTMSTTWRCPRIYSFRRIFNIPSIVIRPSTCKQVHKPGCCILVLPRTQ